MHRTDIMQRPPFSQRLFLPAFPLLFGLRSTWQHKNSIWSFLDLPLIQSVSRNACC